MRPYTEKQEAERAVVEEQAVIEEEKVVVKKEKKLKTLLTIDITEASSAQALVETIIKDSNGLYKKSLSKDNSQMRYTHCNVDDEQLIKVLTEKNRIINRYPGCRQYSHKDVFARYMKVCMDMCPDAYSFVPPQFEYPKDHNRLMAYMKTKKDACFIAKPQGGSQGESIILFRDIKELQLKLSCKNNPEYVVQLYIDKPMLVNGYKYDLRIYVAVVGTGTDGQDMHAFVCDEGLARFCTEKYQKPTRENFRNDYMHLTNYSINKSSPNYIWEPEDVLAPNDGSKRTLTALYKQFDEMGIDTDKIKESIKYSCQGIMQMLANLVQHQVTISLGGKKPTGKVFQVFGFDILLDHKYKAWILELNDHPSFNIFYSNEFMNTKKEDEILSFVDLHVKKQVMEDALKLVCLKKSQLRDIEDDFENCRRILPCEDQDHDYIGQSMYSIRQLFYKLCSVRDKEALSSGNFEKLRNVSIIKRSGIQRANLNLLFQKHGNCKKTIDVLEFVDLSQGLLDLCNQQNQVDVGDNVCDFVKILLDEL